MHRKRTICSHKNTSYSKNSISAQSVSQPVYKKDELRCWFLRNNSHNVNKLLAPYFFDPAAREDLMSNGENNKKITLTSNCNVNSNLQFSGRCQDCYCNEDPVVPRLNPKNFLNEEDYPNHLYDELEGKFCHLGDAHACFKHNLCGDYPDGRMEKPIQTKYCCQSGDTLCSDSKAFPYNALNYKKVTSPKDESSEQLTLLEKLQKNNEVPDDLGVINKFRNDNFFECHSSVCPSTDSIPPHKCLHKFEINERLMPEPKNCDVFGTSRCIVCNLPMKTQCDIHKKYINPRVKSKKLNNASSGPVYKTYTEDFYPRKINISCGCEDVEVTFPKTLKPIGKTVYQMYEEMRRHTPKNTLALRFQKGISK